jgi:dienelactone hydrolase
MTPGLSVVAFLGLAWGGAPLPVAQPQKLVDQGTFVVTVRGRRAGEERFSILEIGTETEIRTKSRIAGPKGVVAVRGWLRTDKNARPLRARFDTQVGAEKRRLTLAARGDLLELTTEGPAPRMILYTRPTKRADLFLSSATTVLTHLAPICRLAGNKDQNLIAFPAAPLHLAAAKERSFPQTKVGAPAVELKTVLVDVAQTMRFEIVCDGPKLLALRQNVSGLTAVRAGYEPIAAALETVPRTKPSVPETLVDLARVVRVPGGGGMTCALMLPRTHAEVKKRNAAPPQQKPTTVGGIVYTPEPPKPLPAVLFLSDAGVRDRDGDPAGTGDANASLLKHLAIWLGEAGIASLRCDKRGVEAASHGRTQPNSPLRELAADARAQLAALRAQPAIDPEKLGLVGHGEGALVAALAGAEDGKLRVVVLLAAAGRPLDAVLLEEAEVSLRRFGYPEEEIRSTLADQKALYEAVRAGKPLPKTLSPNELRSARSALGWMRGHFATDPATATARLGTVPVLLAQGDRDERLSAADRERLRAALAKAGNTLVTTKSYPELNHTFAKVSAGSLADDLGPRAEVDDNFLRDTSAFVQRTLVLPPAPPPTAAPVLAAKTASPVPPPAPLAPPAPAPPPANRPAATPAPFKR